MIAVRIRPFRTAWAYAAGVVSAVVLMLAAFGSVTSKALATTHITSDIKTNTTWGPSGSPYLLDKQVKVVTGVTLKILPGTQVEFNSTSSLTFYVEGSIESVGSAESPIEFTSSQAVEGKGAPGQYHGVNVLGASANARFSFTKFYDGGAGSGGYYVTGVLTAQSGATLLVEDSTFEWNAYSGIKLADVSSAKIFESTLKHNGDGIAGTAAPITVAHNTIAENAEYGLYFNWIKMTTQPGAEVENNEVTKNGAGGVFLSGYCTAALSTFPHGSFNNIYSNGPAGEYPADGSEMRTLYPCEALHVNWDNNYWGSAEFLSGPKAILDGKFVCKVPVPKDYWVGSEVESGRFLGYSSYSPFKIPGGPISTAYSVGFVPVDCTEGSFDKLTYYSIYNAFYVGEYSTEPFVIT
jgi:hypothetical protein